MTVSKEQVEELIRFAGIERLPHGSHDKFHQLDAFRYPDGCIYSFVPDFPHDLNACFKYIVPKAIQLIRVKEAIALRDAEALYFRKWLFMRDNYSQSDWVECLCLAVLKLIKGGIRCQIEN